MVHDILKYLRRKILSSAVFTPKKTRIFMAVYKIFWNIYVAAFGFQTASRQGTAASRQLPDIDPALPRFEHKGIVWTWLKFWTVYCREWDLWVLRWRANDFSWICFLQYGHLFFVKERFFRFGFFVQCHRLCSYKHVRFNFFLQYGHCRLVSSVGSRFRFPQWLQRPPCPCVCFCDRLPFVSYFPYFMDI